MPRRLIAFTAILAVALTIAAAPALAAQVSQEGYNTPASVVQSDVNSNSTNSSATRTTSGSQLPFTGLDVGLIAGAGAVLLLLGVSMARLTRVRSRTE